MKATGEDPIAGEHSGGGDAAGAGRTVVVGVKVDEQSKELLTWALVKVAQSGDRVIALHVLLPTAATAGSTTLLSLVKSFDSMLAAYEGFCHLKQVDLKLKVCRGSSVREILVQEARCYPSAKIIVGTCSANHTIRPTTSIAKYCGRKLPKDYWVLGVDNGKVTYQRKPKTSTENLKDNGKHKNFVLSIRQSLVKKSNVPKDTTRTAVAPNKKSFSFDEKLGLAPRRETRLRGCSPADSSCSKSEEDSSGDDVDNSLALVPFQSPEVVRGSSTLVARSRHMLKPGCELIRRMFSPKRQSLEKLSVKKISIGNWVPRSPSRHCSAAVYPDQKQNHSDRDEGHSFNLDGDNSMIVPFGSSAISPPPSHKCHLKSLPKELEGLHQKYSSSCRLFSYEELLSLTSNFMPELMVGKGGNSQVYRGCLPDGRELAIKSLKPSENAMEEFVSEIDIITTLHHKNIISLFGFCFEDSNLLLVYDFMSRGSLEENLHGSKKDGVSFGWEERYKVAMGVAEALDYLHNVGAQPVIHRDVKSSNILLLDDFEPQLADFGLATLASASLSQLTCTDVAGTFGYLAPEYFMHGKADDKVDVYAYGVVLLELLSGRKAINGQESLVTWAKPILKAGKFSQLLDPTLGSDYDHDQIERMVLAATLCVRRAPRFRPQMSSVLKLLQGETEVTNSARQEVNALGGGDALDVEVLSDDMQSHLNLALQGLEDDSLSSCSTEQSISVEDYLRGRWSRSSSFD